MIKIWKWIRNNPNRAMFLVPIILVAFISISHVVTWYDMANPINWAIYLSVAIEIAAMTALVAVDSRIKGGGIWFMFGLVTFIQVIGNVFYCFKEIDSNGPLFIAWVELTSPVWELVGTEVTDIISLKRWLAFLEGGLLPIISLTSLHFFITYGKENNSIEPIVEKKEPQIIEFNKPYPFTSKMKEGIKRAEEAEIKDENIVVGDDNESEDDIIIATPTTPPVEEEGKAESVEATTPVTSGDTQEEIEIYDPIADEEEKKKIEDEEKRKEKEIIEAMKKAEEVKIEEEKKKIEEEKKKIEEKKKKIEEEN